jgi:hypothetical protein
LISRPSIILFGVIPVCLFTDDLMAQASWGRYSPQSKMREVEHQPGDFVYVLDTAHIKGRAKKLDPPPGKAQEL